MGGLFGQVGNIFSGLWVVVATLMRNIFVRIAVFLILLIAAGFVGLTTSFGSLGEATAFLTNLTATTSAEEESARPVYVDMRPVTVTLRREAGSTLARAQVVLKVPARDAAQVAQLEPEIIDSLHSFFSTVDESDLEGAAGMYRVRAEVLRRIKFLDGGENVQDVLFTEFLVQ